MNHSRLEKAKLLSKLELRTIFKLKFSGISNRKLYLYNNAKVEAHPTTKIVVHKNGSFHFNSTWIAIDPFPSMLYLGEKACLEVDGEFKIYSGSRVYINSSASLHLGSGYINSNFNLSCFKRVDIGYEVAISEGVTIRDSDDHTLIGSSQPIHKPIKIGNRVWIGMNATILKGVTIGDGAVVAAGAVVVKDIPPRCLAAGVPAKVIRENVDWHL